MGKLNNVQTSGKSCRARAAAPHPLKRNPKQYTVKGDEENKGRLNSSTKTFTGGALRNET